MAISLLYPSQCILGESPLWHEARGSCFWTDIEKGILYELNLQNREIKEWKPGTMISLVLESNDGRLVLGIQGAVVQFDPNDGSMIRLADIDRTVAYNRCNDGACDSMGRLWVGTMNLHCKEGAGSLFRVDKDLRVTKMISHLTIPNGLVWSADNKHMYLIDSTSYVVRSYAFNKTTGDIHDEGIAIRIPRAMGIPDGMAIDEKGMLWIALYGGFAVSRWDPRNGKLIRTIRLPVPNITNCCFAGERMDQLIVTTARENLSSKLLKKYPQSGDVFIIDGVGVRGVKNNQVAYAGLPQRI